MRPPRGFPLTPGPSPAGRGENATDLTASHEKAPASLLSQPSTSEMPHNLDVICRWEYDGAVTGIIVVAPACYRGADREDIGDYHLSVKEVC